ncbi:MAG TPA: tetratricopeptide repeat protein [Candidatus Ozemobacteraceae bacterium]|nr:tetratricopeptide repeat protein [Candidatus Ozemobacteraceae bacterium]
MFTPGFPNTLARAVLVYLLTCAVSAAAWAAPHFLPTEDVIGPDGIVLTVNDVTRQPYTGGLGGGRQDRIEIQMTFVNTGRKVFPVDPLKEFSIELVGSYPAAQLDTPGCLAAPFNVNPGTQSRGTLCFRVDASETGTPMLRLVRDRDAVLSIRCDMELGRLFEQSANGFPEIEGGLRLIRFMIEAERLEIARDLVEKGLRSYPQDQRMVLLSAMVRRRLGDTEGAAEAVTSIGANASLNREDALELARQAFELSQYGVAQRILEPFATSGNLAEKDLLFLARCWYFDRQYERAERLLTDLHARGYRDRTLYFTLGNLLEKREDWNGALRWWEKSLEVDPTYYEAQFNIGVALLRLDDRSGAVERWRRVLIMDPDPETRQAAEDAIRSLE